MKKLLVFLLLAGSLIGCGSKEEAAPAKETAPKEAPAKETMAKETSAEVIQSGVWKTIDFAVAGTWTIEKREDGMYFVVDKDFKTDKGPDLHFILSPKAFDEVTHENANDDSFVVGGPLKKFKGAMEFKFSEDVNLADYKTLLLHCVGEDHLWSGATLN